MLRAATFRWQLDSGCKSCLDSQKITFLHLRQPAKTTTNYYSSERTALFRVTKPHQWDIHSRLPIKSQRNNLRRLCASSTSSKVEKYRRSTFQCARTIKKRISSGIKNDGASCSLMNHSKGGKTVLSRKLSKPFINYVVVLEVVL